MRNKVYRLFLILIGKGALLDRFFILRKISKYLVPEYRFKWPQLDWWNDRDFDRYLVKFDGVASVNSDRRWMVFQLLRWVGNVDGDTAECGAYKGASSYMILYMNKCSALSNKHHHIFDSFEGISEPKDIDGDFWTEKDLCSPENVLLNNLDGFKNFTVYKGWIPYRFDEIKTKSFSFVHIDVDLYEPTRDSIEFFYPRMCHGGIIICDDYGFNSCPGATKAIDDFLSDKPEKVTMLSAGGGFFVKGQTIAVGNFMTDFQ